jgi:hypothetical protein
MQTVDIDALLDRHRDRFRKLVQAILTEEAGEDPFSFPLSRFKALSDDEKAELVQRADRIAHERIDRELEARGASWLVLVGGEVVLASRDPQAIPTVEEVLRLGEARDLVPYLFEAPLIEELPGVELLGLRAQPGRDDAHHLPRHEPLDLRRIGELLADTEPSRNADQK